jgi:hypothetical protein
VTVLHNEEIIYTGRPVPVLHGEEILFIQGDLYSMVKKKCTVEAGVPSQVVTATVLNKPKGLMSVATKVSRVLILPCRGGMGYFIRLRSSNGTGTKISGFHSTIFDAGTRYFWTYTCIKSDCFFFSF